MRIIMWQLWAEKYIFYIFPSDSKSPRCLCPLGRLVFSIALTKTVLVPEYRLHRHDSAAIVWLFRYTKQVAQEFGKTKAKGKRDLKVKKKYGI